MLRVQVLKEVHGEKYELNAWTFPTLQKAEASFEGIREWYGDDVIIEIKGS